MQLLLNAFNDFWLRFTVNAPLGGNLPLLVDNMASHYLPLNPQAFNLVTSFHFINSFGGIFCKSLRNENATSGSLTSMMLVVMKHYVIKILNVDVPLRLLHQDLQDHQDQDWYQDQTVMRLLDCLPQVSLSLHQDQQTVTEICQKQQTVQTVLRTLNLKTVLRTLNLNKSFKTLSKRVLMNYMRRFHNRKTN